MTVFARVIRKGRTNRLPRKTRQVLRTILLVNGGLGLREGSTKTLARYNESGRALQVLPNYVVEYLLAYILAAKPGKYGIAAP